MDNLPAWAQVALTAVNVWVNDTLTAPFADRSLPFEGRRADAGGIDRDWQAWIIDLQVRD